MKIEISDEVYEKYRNHVETNRLYPQDVSAAVERLVTMALLEYPASGYELDGLTGCGRWAKLKRDIDRFTFGSGWEDHEAFQKRTLCVDIEGFKHYNDRQGMNEGDEVLVQVAEALRSRYPQCPIYRIGGDEFAVDLQEEDSPTFDIPAPADITLKFALVQITSHKNQSQRHFLNRAIWFHIEEGIVRSTPEGITLSYDYTDIK